MVGEFDKPFERPETRAVAGARENADQQFASLRLLFLQQCFDRRVLGGAGPERRSARDVLDSERLEHVKIPIDEMRRLYFSSRLRFEVREEVERAIRAP